MFVATVGSMWRCVGYILNESNLRKERTFHSGFEGLNSMVKGKVWRREHGAAVVRDGEVAVYFMCVHALHSCMYHCLCTWNLRQGAGVGSL